RKGVCHNRKLSCLSDYYESVHKTLESESLAAMLKLILADNQAIFRSRIAKVLAVEDDMRIVAQAQTPEQMIMAVEKFRDAVLVFAGTFHPDLNAVIEAANKAKTR